MPRKRKLFGIRPLGELGRASHQQTQHGLYFATENKLFLQLMVLHATRHLRYRVGRKTPGKYSQENRALLAAGVVAAELLKRWAHAGEGNYLELSLGRATILRKS